MTHRETIAKILADAMLDLEKDPRRSGRVAELEKLIPELGWKTLEREMLALLTDSQDADLWNVAAGVFWGAALDRREVDANRVIACLYLRFPPGDSLTWSITCKLKGVGYSSDYDPMQDPDVLRELDAVRASQPA